MSKEANGKFLGLRKFIIAGLTIVLIFTAMMFGKVGGETATITMAGLAGGYAGIEVIKKKLLK